MFGHYPRSVKGIRPVAAPLEKAEDLLPIGVVEVSADAVEVAEFAAALGLSATPCTAPLTFPIRWLASPALRGAIQQVGGMTYPVQASQSFLYNAPIVPGRNYQLQIALRQGSAHSRRLTVHGALGDGDDGIVLTFESDLYPANALSTATKPTKQRSGGDSLPELDIGPIDARSVARYAAVARDDNPLHYDPEFARSVGLEGPILPGMMMMGLFQRALSEWSESARVVRLAALFVRPVPVGSRITIGGNIVLHHNPEIKKHQIVRFFVRTERDPIVCVGEASIGSDPSARLAPTK